METDADGTTYTDLIDWAKSKAKLTRVYHTKIILVSKTDKDGAWALRQKVNDVLEKQGCG